MEIRHKAHHALNLVLLSIILFIFCNVSGTASISTGPHPYKKYGKWPAIIMYIMRFLVLVPFPICICNLLGLVFFNTYPEKPKLKSASLFGPFICFRVVTRGTFPELVKKNVTRNINICSELGLDNYIFEVVTDRAVNMTKNAKIREIVVPNNYQTTKGSLYKARALQYCLEDDVNMLADNDWIVHLDEETILTNSCIIGILNFIHDGEASFGQGVITYANEEIVNWLTTLADMARVGIDYGTLRFTLSYLRKPLFSWKGSFVVSNAAAERKVSFDFGAEGSLAEDCFFGLTAWKHGYKFGFIEGEMWEKSTFSVRDYIHQRKRWAQGIIMTFLSRNIPPLNKFGISIMILGWLTMPFTVPNIILVPLFPLPMPMIISLLTGFMGGVMMFLFIFGAMKSFNYRRIGLIKYIVLCLSPIFLFPIFVVMETAGVVAALCSMKTAGFHIVKKEVDTTITRHDLQVTNTKSSENGILDV